MAEELTAEHWVTSAPKRESTYQLADDHPEAIQTLQEAGYEGEAWIKCRALTEAERQERESFQFEGEFGSTKVRQGTRATFRFMVGCMIIDARLPMRKGDGYAEFPWEKAKGRQNKNYEQLDTMGRSLAEWVYAVLRRANLDDEEEQELLDETGNSSTAAES